MLPILYPLLVSSYQEETQTYFIFYADIVFTVDLHIFGRNIYCQKRLGKYCESLRRWKEIIQYVAEKNNLKQKGFWH